MSEAGSFQELLCAGSATFSDPGSVFYSLLVLLGCNY
jgi:hypothetical protein